MVFSKRCVWVFLALIYASGLGPGAGFGAFAMFPEDSGTVQGGVAGGGSGEPSEFAEDTDYPDYDEENPPQKPTAAKTALPKARLSRTDMAKAKARSIAMRIPNNRITGAAMLFAAQMVSGTVIVGKYLPGINSVIDSVSSLPMDQIQRLYETFPSVRHIFQLMAEQSYLELIAFFNSDEGVADLQVLINDPALTTLDLGNLTRNFEEMQAAPPVIIGSMIGVSVAVLAALGGNQLWHLYCKSKNLSGTDPEPEGRKDRAFSGSTCAAPEDSPSSKKTTHVLTEA